MGEGGEVFVLDMGEQLKVIDVARDLIRLSGHTEEEIEIKITGLVPGEKMYEELFYEDDIVEKTMHSKIMVCRKNTVRETGSPRAASQENAKQAQHESPFHVNVTALIEAAQMGSTSVVSDLFHRIVPQYDPTTFISSKRPSELQIASEKARGLKTAV
jgi:FlaA1/EpsC-like NDP-sugar epimerase